MFEEFSQEDLLSDWMSALLKFVVGPVLGIYSIGHILAIMRQWVPQTQHAIDTLLLEIMKRGAHPDDRDSLTDMTLVMYACKAGASGVGSVDTASKITEYLVKKGADLSAKCRWTDMAPLHYATFFDVAPVLTTLLHHTKGADVDTQCIEYENGTPLHIAASNLCLGAARVLLKFGADVEATDDLGRRAVECIPDAASFELVPDAQELINKMTRLLSEGLEGRQRMSTTLSKSGTNSISGRTILQAMGLKLNDRVVVNNKLGTLRFCGTTEFAPGMWAGVELDTPEGKNDGTVKGIRYFRCDNEHGIFVMANKVAKAGRGYKETSPLASNVKRPAKPVNFGKVDVSHVQGKIQTAMAIIAEKAEIRVGDRVHVKEVMPGRGAKGVVRFIGSVDFVDDMSTWFGIELDVELGRHDGTVQGVRYFAAGKDRGVFVTASKLLKLDADDNYDSCDDSVCESQISRSTTPSTTQRRSLTASAPPTLPGGRVRRSLSLRHHENKAGVIGEQRPTPPSRAPSNISLARSMSVRRVKESVPDFQTGPGPVFSKFKKRVEKKYLDVGQGVMIIHSKEMATIKYVGHTDFAPGIWIGLELRNPKGKHNGEVQSRRYFSCKDRHGIMVRPRTLSVHGINGQDLLRPESHYPI